MGLWTKLIGREDRPPESARDFGRNDKCWCGSGKKYKHCHLEADKRYFSRELAATCKAPGG